MVILKIDRELMIVQSVKKLLDFCAAEKSTVPLLIRLQKIGFNLPNFAFSGPKFKKTMSFLQELPNFDISVTNEPKSIPSPRLNSTRIANKYTLG